MNRVLIVCGAGASSTFLAHRMRAAARRRDLEVTVSAASVIDLDARLEYTDVLLIGPHLESQYAGLAASAESARVEVALLPRTIYGPLGEDTALDLAESLRAS